MMQQVFDFLWSFNVELSLLLLLVLGLRWLLRKTANIYNAYWLWFALPLVPLITELVMVMAPMIEPLYALNRVATSPFTEFTVSDNRIQPNSVDGISTAQTPDSSESQRNIKVALVVFWIIGCGCALIRLAIQHYTLRKELSRSDYQHDINLSAMYPISGVVKQGFSPAVYGFLKPRIYFPLALNQTLDDKQRALIVQHEEQHIRQGHLWLNLCWDVLVCLLWFNPLTYLARHAFRHDQELLCDYLVLKNYDEPHQRAYGHALISTVSATHSVNLLCSWKMFDQLEERIMNIKTQHPRFKTAIMAGAMATTLVVSSLYALATAHEIKKQVKVIELAELLDENDTDRDRSVSIIRIDRQGDRTVSIKTNGKTFNVKDGERYIIENGERRELTKTESEELSDLLEKSEKYALAKGKHKGGIFDQENVSSFSFDFDDEDDLAKTLKEKFGGDLQIIEIEDLDDGKIIEMHKVNALTFVDPLNGVDREIERALKRAQDSKSKSIEKARKLLEASQKKLATSREKLHKQQEEAMKQLAELEKLSEQG